MKRWFMPILAMMTLALLTTVLFAGGGATAITVTGTSACAQCEGIANGHDVALTTENGLRFVLKGDGDEYKAVHQLRKQGKTITATLVGAIMPMKNDDGEAYLESKVSGIRIEPAKPVFVIGTSACAQCVGIAKGHDVALTTENGLRFVLKGDGDEYKAVHQVRKESKTITATLAGPIKPMKNDKGEPYLEVPVSSVKVNS